MASPSFARNVVSALSPFPGFSSPFQPSRSSKGIVVVRRDIQFVESLILSELRQFDLCNSICHQEPFIVGKGSFSDVYRGMCRSKDGGVIMVAMKRLRLHVNALECKKLFEKEIYVWSKLHHFNVLPFLGYAFDADTGYPMLISEWMEYGNALTYVRSNDLSLDRVMDLVFDIARGLAYLHDQYVIHSDIKPENVLISRAGVAMICDFGSARMEAASHSFATPTSTLRGTCNYWAPELLSSEGNTLPAHTTMSDIWAFGMTVYALVTRDAPYRNISQFGVPMAICRGQLPIFPDHFSSSMTIIAQNVEDICLRCWNWEPNMRPTATAIVSVMLESTKSARNGQDSQLADEAMFAIIPKLLKAQSISDPSGSFLRITFSPRDATRSGNSRWAASKLKGKSLPPCTELYSGIPVYFATSCGFDGKMPTKAFMLDGKMQCDGSMAVSKLKNAETFTVLPFESDIMELVTVSDGQLPTGRRPIEGGFELTSARRRALYHVVVTSKCNERFIGRVREGDKAQAFIRGFFSEFSEYEILCWKD